MSQQQSETAAQDFYKTEQAKEKPGYNPEALLEAVKIRLSLKNDAALARALHFAPPVISKVRHRILPVTPLVLLRVIEATGWTPKQARKFLGA